MKQISSRQNPWFKRVRDAIREHGGEIVLEGPKAISDAIAGGWKPLAVIQREGSDALHDDRAIVFAPAIFGELSSTNTSQGVIALFERPASDPRTLLSRADSVIVALDGVQDPGNVGTIVRLAAAFDAAGVALLPGCADPFGQKAIRASAGSILNVPVAQLTARELLASRLPIFAAEGGGKKMDPPASGAILLFGSEGAGISPDLRDAATPIAIATSSRVESLNVAAAAAILLERSYALRRR